MDKYLDLFIKNSRNRMEELGLTQNDVAKRLGIAHTNVSQLLNGKRGGPNLTTLSEWESVLEVNSGDLLKDIHLRPIAKKPSPAEALAVLAEALNLAIPDTAPYPKEIRELLQMASSQADWQRVEEALKLALLPDYAAKVLADSDKENAG